MRAARERTVVAPPDVEEQLWAEQHAGLNVLTRLATRSSLTQRSEPTVLAPHTAGRQAPAKRSRWQALEHSRWVLPAVLAIQSIFSLRLVWSTTAFSDEALYLWSGHLEWSHWLYGAQIPAFPGYFSGSAMIYPPVGAFADAIGGLAGARILSLCFMLGATVMLHGVTRRIFGRHAAFFAVALFVGLGSAQFLGAFATYDAMALMLLALATWLGVQAANCRPGYQVVLAISAAGVLAIADAAKYAAGLFDPVVIATVVLVVWRATGRKAGFRVCAVLSSVLLLVLLAALRLGGSVYWHGIASTTLSRSSGTWPIFGILYVSVGWVGIMMLLALIGSIVVFLTWRDLPGRLLALTLLAAPFLAPAEQARIHVFTSLFKHVGYGAWFGAIIAGYALTSFLRAVPDVKANGAEAVSVLLVVLTSISGALLATDHFVKGWPDSASYTANLRPWVASTHGRLLMDDASIPEYYAPGLVTWQHVTNNVYFAYTDPATRKRLLNPPAAYADAIRHRYFSLIALTYGNAPSVYDPGIVKDIKSYGGYKLVVDLPYRMASNRGAFMVWVRTGAK